MTAEAGPADIRWPSAGPFPRSCWSVFRPTGKRDPVGRNSAQLMIEDRFTEEFCGKTVRIMRGCRCGQPRPHPAPTPPWAGAPSGTWRVWPWLAHGAGQPQRHEWASSQPTWAWRQPSVKQPRCKQPQIGVPKAGRAPLRPADHRAVNTLLAAGSPSAQVRLPRWRCRSSLRLTGRPGAASPVRCDTPRPAVLQPDGEGAGPGADAHDDGHLDTPGRGCEVRTRRTRGRWLAWSTGPSCLMRLRACSVVHGRTC